MKSDAARLALMEGTVRVVSRDGLDKATTKAIAVEAKVNEVNIYRLFNGKEDLLRKTFAALDRELASELFLNIPLMKQAGVPMEERCWSLFAKMWQFLLGGPDKCVYYIRYYYSPYFLKFSAEDHRVIFKNALDEFVPAFQEGADVWMILVHILDLMLSFAVKVFNGALPNDDETAYRVYDLVYSSVEPQLSWSRSRILKSK